MHDSSIERTQLRFESSAESCVGYLYRAGAVGAQAPCVVFCHGFSGTQDTPSMQAVVQAVAGAGMAALTFDYRHFGESAGTPRQLIKLAEQQEDVRAAIRHVRCLDGIDASRVALWGTSLGGGHVVAVAADDPSIAAVVAQVPFNGFPQRVEGRSAMATLRLLGAMADDALRGWLGFGPKYIPVAGPTGSLAVMASPQAQETVEALQSPHWRNEIAPRVLFEMMRYKPSALAPRLQMPILVCIAERDLEAPAYLARQIAERAPRGEAKSYGCAHFDFYRPDIRGRVILDQIDFLRRHLLPDGAGTRQ